MQVFFINKTIQDKILKKKTANQHQSGNRPNKFPRHIRCVLITQYKQTQGPLMTDRHLVPTQLGAGHAMA